MYVSQAERRVLDAFMQDGAANRVIAGRVLLTEDTVKTHLRHIFRKAVTALGPDCHRLDRTGLAVALGRGRLVVRMCHTPAFHDRERYPQLPEDHTCHPPS